MENFRAKIPFLVMLIAVVTAIALLAMPLVPRQAEAAVTLYTVAQGYPETDILSWSSSGIPSRGINSPKRQVGTVTMDNSYATGGETFDLSGTFPNAVLNCIFAAEQGYSFEYVHSTGSVPATGLIKAYNGAGTEAASGGDMSSFVVEFQAVGW